MDTNKNGSGLTYLECSRIMEALAKSFNRGEGDDILEAAYQKIENRYNRELAKGKIKPYTQGELEAFIRDIQIQADNLQEARALYFDYTMPGFVATALLSHPVDNLAVAFPADIKIEPDQMYAEEIKALRDLLKQISRTAEKLNTSAGEELARALLIASQAARNERDYYLAGCQKA